MRLLLLALLSAAAAAPAAADVGGPAVSAAAAALRVLTWQDCVRLALEKSPDLTASQRALLAGRASYLSSYNGLLPQVSLSNSLGDSKGSSGASRWGLSGSVNMSLLNLGQAAGIRSSAASYDAAAANLRATSASVRFSLRQAFAQLMFAQRNVEVNKSIRDIRRRGSEMVALRYDSGRESKGNMLRAKAQAFQAEMDLAQALRGIRSAQTGLDRHLGFDDFSALAATGSLSAPPAPELPADLGPLVDLRPDVAAQLASLESARASLSQARAPLFPTLSADYSRSRSGPSELPSANYNWTALGVLSYPLFGGGPTAAYFNIQAAKHSLERSRQELRTVRDAATLDLQNTWTNYAGNVDQVRVQQLLLEAARQRSDEADVRYASGLLTYDNWELIVSDRVGTERQALQAQVNAVNAEAAWQKAQGLGLGE